VPVTDHFRAFARRPTSLPVRIQSEVLGWELAAKLVDLGLGGASVVVSEPLPLGTSVRLRIDAPQLWEPLVVPARVAWMRPTLQGDTRLGVRFEPDSPASLAVLAELVGPSGYI
jgi:hypothetical protein